ncbi:GDSL-type esterase/lipase family protein, partial [Modestobacter versicolor]
MTLRFLVLGDSLAFGTGAASPQHTLGARLGRVLQDAGRTVELHVVAVPGATSLDLAAQVRRAPAADVALLVVGANDITHQVPPAQ